MAKNKRPPRRLPTLPNRAVAVGIVWYDSEEQWRKVKDSATDPERFEATYPEWIVMVEESLQRMLVAGLVAEKVTVSADELLAWCLVHGKANDAGARAQFVSSVGAARRRGRP